MADVPEYAQVSATLRDIEREVKRFEVTQKKYQKLHKAVVEANASAEAKTITPKQFNDLKRIYRVRGVCWARKESNTDTNAPGSAGLLQEGGRRGGPGQGGAGAAADVAGAAGGGGRGSQRRGRRAQEGEGVAGRLQGEEREHVEPFGVSRVRQDVALPVWLGSEQGHVPPPPLCGRVPFPAEARIVPGDLVAANTNAGRPKDGPAWILCRVERFSGSQKRNTYLVSDVAPEEGTTAATFDLPRRAIVPLPKTIPKQWNAQTEFAKGDNVMALFPGTTSFYEAVVIDGPSQTEDHSYLLQFEDDDDEKGQTPVRPIRPAYVVASMRK